VLIRAVEPLAGVDAMRASRQARALGRARAAGDSKAAADARERAARRLAAVAPARLAAGPGLVAEALDITLAATGTDLLDAAATLRIEPGEPVVRIGQGPRIGIDYAAEPWRSQPWRFVDLDSPAVSAR
jgi:DNA-3-methyladenine glycosylase